MITFITTKMGMGKSCSKLLSKNKARELAFYFDSSDKSSMDDLSNLINLFECLARDLKYLQPSVDRNHDIPFVEHHNASELLKRVHRLLDKNLVRRHYG